jgi:sialate O-acetylesterase
MRDRSTENHEFFLTTFPFLSYSILIQLKTMRLTILILLFFTLNLSAQDLKLAEIFTNHAVLQRGKMLKVWGWAAPNASIFLTLDEYRFRGIANGDGEWEITLAKFKAGGPHEMIVTDRISNITLEDLYFGDVWICSGQSNMEWTVKQSEELDSIKNYGSLPNIRHVKVNRSYEYEPSQHLDAQEWELATAETIGDFTGVGFHFAKSISENHDVPIGLLHSSWGGSRIEAWMSEKLLLNSGKNADMQAVKDGREELQLLTEKYSKVAPEITNGMWTEENFDASNWMNAELPGAWENNGFPSMNGEVYYRKTFELTAKEANQATKISLSKIDDNDWTYINGKLIGKIKGWDILREYEIPANTLKAGKNVIAVKVEDGYGGGGFHGSQKNMFMQIGDNRIPLSGTWEMQLGKVNFLPQMEHQPTILYNKMIHPLNKFPVRGVLWYQGESNAAGQDAIDYADLFKAMITDWRAIRNDPEMKFYWVQLANFMKPTNDANKHSNWAILRSSQSAALELENTAEAVIIDVGEADDIHPKDKKTVGQRLARAACAQVYGETDLPYENPRILNLKIKKNTLILSYENVAGGLKIKDGQSTLKGFAIAGKDGVFHWATAEIISSKQVRISSDKISKPTQVRYAWADNPEDANLYNSEGLPAAPTTKKVK